MRAVPPWDTVLLNQINGFGKSYVRPKKNYHRVGHPLHLVGHPLHRWSPTTSGLHGVKMSQIKSGDNDGDDDADLSKAFEKTVRRLIETPPKPHKKNSRKQKPDSNTIDHDDDS